MLVAAIGSTGYKVVLILHLLFLVVAFAPAFVWPMLNRQQKAAAQGAGPNDAGAANEPVTLGAIARIADPMMHGGSLVLAGLFGIGLIGMSDKIFEFSQTWVSLAFLFWFLMLGLFFAGLIPAQRAVRDHVADAESRLAMCYGGMHLLLLLQIIVMVWKPGL